MSTNICSYSVLLLDGRKQQANPVMLIDSFVSFSVLQHPVFTAEQLKLKYLLLCVTTLECLVAMAVQFESKKLSSCRLPPVCVSASRPA